MRWILPLLALGMFIVTAANATDILCGVNGCVEQHHDYYGERRERERGYYGDRHSDDYTSSGAVYAMIDGCSIDIVAGSLQLRRPTSDGWWRSSWGRGVAAGSGAPRGR